MTLKDFFFAVAIISAITPILIAVGIWVFDDLIPSIQLRIDDLRYNMKR